MLKGLTPLQAGAALAIPARETLERDRGNVPGTDFDQLLETCQPPGGQEQVDTQDNVEADAQMGEPDVRALLEPLPPGWTAEPKAWNPDSEVFEDNFDMDMPSEEETGENPDNDSTQASGMAPPSPVGPPPQLSAQHFGLDEFNTDAEMWAAYRRSQKASYREYRKRERVAGTWTKDQQRGGHTPRGRERSPLPRRRRHQDGGEPYGEQ